MGGYYLAPCLVVLRDEINQRWPRRDRTSDGWIGDAAHQATRSDHNPNERGSVDAIDVDVDGIDPYAVLAAFERHPSAHYWIYNRQIADADDGWRRHPYSGPSPHIEHLHGSIRQTRAAEQDTRPWGLLEDDMPLTADDLSKVRTQVALGLYDALWVSATGKDYRELTYSGPGSIGAAIRANLGALTAGPVLAALRGLDVVDEADRQAIIAGILAGLDPTAIAAAIPPELARQVADELARRMVS